MDTTQANSKAQYRNIKFSAEAFLDDILSTMIKQVEQEIEVFELKLQNILKANPQIQQNVQSQQPKRSFVDAAGRMMNPLFKHGIKGLVKRAWSGTPTESYLNESHSLLKEYNSFKKDLNLFFEDFGLSENNNVDLELKNLVSTLRNKLQGIFSFSKTRLYKLITQELEDLPQLQQQSNQSQTQQTGNQQADKGEEKKSSFADTLDNLVDAEKSGRSSSEDENFDDGKLSEKQKIILQDIQGILKRSQDSINAFDFEKIINGIQLKIKSTEEKAELIDELFQGNKLKGINNWFDSSGNFIPMFRGIAYFFIEKVLNKDPKDKEILELIFKGKNINSVHTELKRTPQESTLSSIIKNLDKKRAERSTQKNKPPQAADEKNSEESEENPLELSSDVENPPITKRNTNNLSKFAGRATRSN